MILVLLYWGKDALSSKVKKDYCWLEQSPEKSTVSTVPVFCGPPGIEWEKAMRVGWKVHRLTMMQLVVEFDQMWFIFQYSLPCGPHTSSISVAVLGFPWYRSSHPDPQKSPLTADMTSSSVQYCFPAKCFSFSFRRTENRWCQIRRIWRVINQSKP